MQNVLMLDMHACWLQVTRVSQEPRATLDRKETRDSLELQDDPASWESPDLEAGLALKDHRALRDSQAWTVSLD